MTEINYSAKQVAEALNISTAMLRRYALAYEELTGEEIRQVKRDGRKYTQAQLETFLRAKAFVESDPNMTVVWGLKAALGEVDAISLPPLTEPRGSDSTALIEALRLAVTAPLTEELRLLRLANERLLERLEAVENRQLPSSEATAQVAGESADERLDHDELQTLRNEVASLRAQLAETRPLPPPATPERIDRALEVEMQESRADPEIPPAAQKVINTIDSVEPQRVEHESWITEAAVQALITASELPAKPREGGLFVKAAEWLERKLRGK